MSANETNTLSHFMEKMSVNATPVAKAFNMLDPGDYSSAAVLSPPQTVDTRQKRERSESLVKHYIKETATTKRRLRSRSRKGSLCTDEQDPSSSTTMMMITPCSSKFRPTERTFTDHEAMSSPSLSKHFNDPACSVFMTPCSEEPPRQPLQCRDLNASIFHPAVHPITETNYDYSSSSDSSSGEEELKTKLTFEDDEESRKYATPIRPSACDMGMIIGHRMGEKKVDFIQELVNLNCEEICKKIFCYLEPKNLQRVASVSKLWRRVCKKDRMASPRLDLFVHGRKQYVIQKGKENLGHRTKQERKIPHRTPLSSKNNTLWTPEQEQSMRNKEALETIKTDIISTYEKVKCPSCGSPSRKLDDDVCECDKCQGMFCQSCQHRIDEHHKTGKCAIKLKKSKKGKHKEVIGSKQSKSRLKRF